MPAPLNPFKEALKKDELQLGCWLSMSEGYVAEMSATAGFDWLLIDGEHAPNDLRSIRDQLQVIDASPSHPIVRIPIGEPWMVKQVLDAGAQSVLVPMVESAQQAEQLVRAVRYPPTGMRGVGSSAARASKFGAIGDYLATADEQICLLVQVENRAGLAALDGILAVDGVDGVFIGPADLAADLGHLGNPGAPEVQAAIRDALERIGKSDKASGILAPDPAFARHCVDLGATFVATAIDVTLFTQAIRGAAAEAQVLRK
ncbi:aldolase/citrate lyase family protein [Hoeflea sp. TYP-13]|uniref:aldolase/citrate lyase family protein n=1 Tax=Hoeflea sp. TYP-13 TaxID=3230023 RepID=UPI0034C6C4FC